MTRARLRAALPWAALVIGLLLATEPAWRLALVGLDPALDDLLRLRCGALLGQASAAP